MRVRSLRGWAFTLLLALGVMGCMTTDPAGDAGMHRALEAHRWTLASASDAQGRRIEALLPGAGRPLVFGFSDTRLAIEGGCNRLFGSYRIDSGRLQVERLASTRMACEPAAMRVDATIGELLQQPARIAVTAGADATLRLVTAGGSTLVFSGSTASPAR